MSMSQTPPESARKSGEEKDRLRLGRSLSRSIGQERFDRQEKGTVPSRSLSVARLGQSPFLGLGLRADLRALNHLAGVG